MGLAAGAPVAVDDPSLVVELLEVGHATADPAGGKLGGAQRQRLRHLALQSRVGEPLVELRERVRVEVRP